MLRRIQLRRRDGAGGRRRVAAGLVLLVAICVIVAIVLITQSSASPSAASASTTASGATSVQRRNLVATDTESGTLSYANPQTVYNRLSGTITWLPAVGQVVSQGQALFRVDHMPVVLLNGNTPAYRDLDASDTAGPDILELNRDLIALGYTSEGIIADDEWQDATTSAVEVFQESLGETATGTLTLGQVVFLPGDQVVSTVDATLGGDGGGSGGSSATDLKLDAPAPQFVSLTTRTNASQGPTSPSQGSTGPSQGSTSPSKSGSHGKHHGGTTGSSSAETIAALIALLKAESAQLKAASAQLKAAGSKGGGSKSGSSGSSGKSGSGSSGSGSSGSGSSGSGSSGSSGSGGGTATAVLQTSSTQLVATVDLDASKQSEAKVGEKVTVEMPAGNTVNGTVSSVSPIAQSSSSSGNGSSGASSGGSGSSGSGSGSSGATIPVNITLSGHQKGAGLDQAAVSVNFVQSEATNVLSVPVTALLATAGGGYAVQEAVAPHKLVPVTTGLFAAGYVQISGPGIYPGLQVTDSQG